MKIKCPFDFNLLLDKEFKCLTCLKCSSKENNLHNFQEDLTTALSFEEELKSFIEDNTKGRLTLGAGTLYGALNSLQEKGWIAPFGDSAGRKKEYLITTQGKEIAEKELIRLNELVGVANEIIGGAV